MGLGMAQRLLSCGHDLRLYNRTRSRATILKEASARVFETPREASAGAEAVIAMTADDTSSRAVWSVADGVLAGSSPHVLSLSNAPPSIRLGHGAFR
jgi:3-hydroxyisobutyrate dehydrogenase